MKELNAEAYVSCLTLISASGSSFIAINLGQELMGGCSLCNRACSDWDCLLASTERWHGMFLQWCKPTTNPQRCFSFHFPLGLVLFLHWSILFHFFLIIKRNWRCRARMQAGRETERACFGELQRWYEQVSEALMFLGRLQTATDNLMIWEYRPF